MNKLMISVALSAALVSGNALAALAVGDAAAGKTKSATCAGCHGADGNSAAGAGFPRLAGQYPDYLVQALKAYKSGERKNPIMSGFAAGLTDADINDLAAYFASQKGLEVLQGE
ncbi:MAG: cytochrome c [Gammaproteobacteria bacterium]|nr:cytochrome c [Gammaproteobacteria bacterium]MCP5136083.1 cytochrome c [Gammaproteobacteria bacterium]